MTHEQPPGARESMTQHPADPLVEKVARAILHRMKESASYSADELAQAALAAVRLEHVVVPRELFDRLTMACMVAMNYAPNSDAVGLERTAREANALTQHDGAKDA